MFEEVVNLIVRILVRVNEVLNSIRLLRSLAVNFIGVLKLLSTQLPGSVMVSATDFESVGEGSIPSRATNFLIV